MKIRNRKLISTISAFIIGVNFFLPLNYIFAIDTGGQISPEQLDPEITRLKSEIQKYQDQVSELDKQRAAYEASLKIKRQEINNLQNQLSILDSTAAKTALEIQSTGLEIQANGLQIADLELQIKYKNEEIKNQQKNMGEVLRDLEKHDRKTSYLEVLVLKGNIGNFFQEAGQLQTLEGALGEKLKSLTTLKNQLNDQKTALENRKSQLDSLNNLLAQKNEQLQSDKNAKAQLLTATKGQQANFQTLLAQVQAEQNQINADIQNLDIQARKKIQQKSGALVNDDGFIWPIPSRRVTAFFHDPDYPFRYVYEHPAIDISASQGTPIRAARSGYVAKVKYDGTTNYAYILLVHTGGLSTVYGHISKPYIKEDDYIVQGEVIALSGATPGSAGAGKLTTGPHLHLEVRLNGIPVDPLAYLP